MTLGKVIGNIWATRKYDTLKGYKMQIVQPVDAELKNNGSKLIAIDTVGAGPGEIVYMVNAGEAVIPLDVDHAPVDASIVGIVDSIYLE